MKYFFLVILLFFSNKNFAQQKIEIDTALQQRLYNHVSALSNDSMMGRLTGSSEMFKAADYIRTQFRNAGLKPVAGFNNYYDSFLIRPSDYRRYINVDISNSITGINVIGGVLGNKRKDELIIYCAHFDHIGTHITIPSQHLKKGNTNKDSIYNGANDNATGTAALIEIARSIINDSIKPERTILFIAFSGEEEGLLGSRSFAENVNHHAVKAVINLEMLGRPGRDGIVISGNNKSDFYKKLNKNLRNTDFSFSKDRNEKEMLFYRSDNYPFFEKNIIAHTIIGTPDNDKYYHTANDEIETIDFKEMTKAVQAIINACKPILKDQTFKYY